MYVVILRAYRYYISVGPLTVFVVGVKIPQLRC